MAENRCYEVGYVSGFNNVEGIILNNKRSDEGWRAQNMIFAENETNVVSHSASGNSPNHFTEMKNVFTTPTARVECGAACYS